ncbi:MAG TPA: dihydrofolate reductase family protein [Acidimicrobiales bacterium]
MVTDGPEAALETARAAAGDADIAVFRNPNLGQQYLAKGLVDEIGVHVVPVVFGAGTPMFGR